MKGILKLSFKLLVNDRPNFLALSVGIAFSVFLMMLVTPRARAQRPSLVI